MLRFGPFEVDFTAAEIRKSGVRVRIHEQPLLILQLLLERRGELVTRAELRDRLWPSDTFVDFERSLNAAVGKLRQSLNDSASRPIYVETVPRKGYRFIAPVTDTEPLQLRAKPLEEAASPAPSSGGRRRWVAAGIVAAALMVMLWVVWPAARPDPERRVTALDLEVGSGVSQPAVSPDGMTLAFVASSGLAIRKLSEGKITPLAGTEGASSPFFSPDAHWVGYFADHKLRKVPVDGGKPVTLCDAPSERGGTWTEAGQIIAALGATGGLSSIPASGGTPRPFGNSEGDPPGITMHRAPAALPGGKGVLFISTPGVASGLLRVLPHGGGPAKTLASGVSTARYLASGYLLYNSGETMFVAPMDPDRLQLTGPATPIIEGLAYNHFRGAEFDVSASGTLVHRRNPPSANRRVIWLGPAGEGRRLLAGKGDYASPRLSPDGKRLALVSDSKIWIYDIAQEKMTPLTFGTGTQCCPVWTLDGDYVAFAWQTILTLARWDGGGTVERLAAAKGMTSVPFSFSRDGWLSFHRNQLQTGTGFDLWTVRVNRTAGTPRLDPAHPLLTQPGLQVAPVISPDGRWLAYASDYETGRMEVYVIPFSPEGPPREGKCIVSTDGGRGPRWSRNGSEILFRSEDDHLMVAGVTAKGNSLQAGKPRLWSTQRMATVGPYPNFDVAPDGSVVALIDAEEAKSDETHLRVWLNVNEELVRQRADGRKPK